MTRLTKKIGSGICMIALLMGIVCPVFAGQEAPAKPAATTSSKPAATTETGSGISMAGTLSVVSDIGALASASAPVVGMVSGMAGADSSISSALSMGGKIASGASSLAEGASNISLGSAMSVAGSALSIAGVKGAASTALQMGGALGSALVGSAKDGIGSIVDNLNLESAKNFGLSIIEDIAPEIKQLMGLKLDDIVSTFSNLTSLSGLKHAYTVIMPDMEVQSGINTASAVAHGVAADQQYNSETAITSTEGPAGNIDYRYTGECKIDNEDYAPAINRWIQAHAVKNEGFYSNLYLDTNCYATVGIGSVLFQPSQKGNLEGYKKYYLTFEYENPVGQEKQIEDITLFHGLEQVCSKYKNQVKVVRDAHGKVVRHPDGRAKLTGVSENETATVNLPSGPRTIKVYDLMGAAKAGGGGASYWSRHLNGHITKASAVKAIFTEICNAHAHSWHSTWKRLNRSFSSLPMDHQIVIFDISYQGGPGTINGCSKCSMKSNISTPFKTAIVQGQCSNATNIFSQAPLCTQYKSRCMARKALLRAPCGG